MEEEIPAVQLAILFDAYRPLTESERAEQLAAGQDFTAVDAVESSLRALGHEVERLPVTDDVYGLLTRLRQLKADLVFNLCETFRRASLPQMNIAALLDLLHMPYTGSGPQALALSTDKAITKSVLSVQGIRVPKFQVVYQVQTQLDAHLSFPLIVKPLYEDGSYGIAGASVVESNIALEDRIAYILDKFHQPSIVEEFIDGREINAAIWGNDPPTVLPLSEIEFRDFPGQMPKIVSFDAKWTTGSFEYQHTIPVCPAPLPDDVERAVRDVALRSHLAIGCRDYSRIDIRLDDHNRPYVIEVNANPDISPESGFMRSLLQSGRSYTDFVALLVASALHR